MAELIIVCWRDIPAQIIVKAGRRSAKRQLDERFQEAIDRAAMRAGLRDTDAYLGEWRRAPPARAATTSRPRRTPPLARLDADYPPERLRALVANGGREAAAVGSSA